MRRPVCAQCRHLQLQHTGRRSYRDCSFRHDAEGSGLLEQALRGYCAFRVETQV